MALIQLLQTVASMVGCFQYLQSGNPHVRATPLCNYWTTFC